ncbi:Protein fam86a [Blomia tropicalis]|nr:Protein fam86a [Blomia tropicalis]
MDLEDIQLIEMLYFRRTNLLILGGFMKLLFQAYSQRFCLNQECVQQQLLNLVSINPIGKQFPCVSSYKRNFIGKLISLFTEYFKQDNSDSEDLFPYEIYEYYSDALKPIQYDCDILRIKDSGENDMKLQLINHLEEQLKNDCHLGFSTFFLPGSTTRMASILETNQIVVDGTTGFRVWPATLHLIDYLLEHNQVETNKHEHNFNVLELGAGSGLLGIALIKLGQFKNFHYTFTDHKQSVLERIKLNLLINDLPFQSSTNISVCELDWFKTQESEAMKNENQYDLILATDVVFDPIITDALIQTLEQLFDNKRTNFMEKPFWPKCFICCADRDASLQEYFRKQIENVGFHISIVERMERPKWYQLMMKRIEIAASNLANEQIESFQQLTLKDSDIVSTLVYCITKN